MTSKTAKPIRPPRLRMKDELLKEDPDLASFLEEAFNSSSPTIAARRPPTAGAAASDMLTLGIDDELTEEEELKLELESVKRERRTLMDSLAALKADQGKAGSERQMADIARLRRELESKQEKINELRQDISGKHEALASVLRAFTASPGVAGLSVIPQEASRAEGQLIRLALTSRDCAALMPDGGPDAQARIRSLEAELRSMEGELAEADAQHRLYSLLEERTRREHFVQDQKVKEAKEALDAFAEDHVVLTSHMHMARFSRENAERDLAAVKAQREAVRSDWQRKLQDCRKEVRGMEHRQKREAEAEEQRRARQAELDAQERERAAQKRLEQDAFERQLASLQPKVEKMEAAWARLHTITGAETPEEVIAYFEGLKSKEASMMELVRLAEYAESKAKEDTAALLSKRSAMLEALTAIDDEEVAGPDEDFSHLEQRIADAQERQETATKQFNRLCSICIAAQQGMRSLLERLDKAVPLMTARRRKSTAPAGVRRSSSMKRSSVIAEARRASSVQPAEQTAASRSQPAGRVPAENTRPSMVGMEGKDGATGRKSIVTSDAPRRQSCILQEKGRKEATAGLVPPSSKVGRLSQVSDARRVSTVGPRRASVVVSQELGAVLGKPNGLATDAVSSSDARDVLTLGRLQGHAFFPELGPLTKAVAEHVLSLASIAGKVLSAQALGEPSPDFRQGVRRATWVGPAWMARPYKEQAADSYTSFGKLTGAQSAQQLHKLADYPADTLYASESEEAQEVKDWDGVVDREFIKHRAAKLLAAAARQREKEHQSAAAAN